MSDLKSKMEGGIHRTNKQKVSGGWPERGSAETFFGEARKAPRGSATLFSCKETSGVGGNQETRQGEARTIM